MAQTGWSKPGATKNALSAQDGTKAVSLWDRMLNKRIEPQSFAAHFAVMSLSRCIGLNPFLWLWLC
jgi:hypothetical protein